MINLYYVIILFVLKRLYVNTISSDSHTQVAMVTFVCLSMNVNVYNFEKIIIFNCWFSSKLLANFFFWKTYKNNLEKRQFIFQIIDKIIGFKGIALKKALPYLQGGSLEITFTVPLIHNF